MTLIAALTAPAGVEVPQTDTVVLLNRKLNPARPTGTLSVFGDDRWDISPGLFEAHAPTVRLHFASVPDRFREAAKHYIWQIINHDDPQPRRETPGRRRALRTIAVGLPHFTAFLHWLDVHEITRIADVTANDLDRYAADIAATEARVDAKSALLAEVRRLWSYRIRLPEPMRLPSAPPWGGESPAALLGGAKRPRENRTHRIDSDTIEALLMWCLRFVEEFAEDITAAYHEHLRLWERGPSNRSHNRHYGGSRGTVITAEAPLRAYLQQLRASGGSLPGRTLPSGQRATDWPHLCRLVDVAASSFMPGHTLRAVVDEYGLPTGPDARLNTPITGRLAGLPWRPTKIGYAEAPELAHLLRSACLITVAYLTGMRPGEILNLERGCLDHDPVSGLWMINGRKWKGVRDTHGDKVPEGQQRQDPWTTVKQAADAIAVLERLHAQTLLFPSQLHPARTRGTRSITRPGQGRTTQEIAKDLTALITWVNTFCDTNGIPDQRIRVDSRGQVALSRFRRTLAWHIIRRPRGLVAGAIQYGHLHVQMTLGYGGTYDSGFPDEHAYEDWLFRLDRLADNHQRLNAGERVSGPAADAYQQRVQAAHEHFAGRVLSNFKQARDMVANPLLQIYPGRAMTCVFDPAKALCQLRSVEGDTRRTPDQDDCQPNCKNIAYTDRDIAGLRSRVVELRDVTSDHHLAPSIRYTRERAELDRVQSVIRRHDHGR